MTPIFKHLQDNRFVLSEGFADDPNAETQLANATSRKYAETATTILRELLGDVSIVPTDISSHQNNIVVNFELPTHGNKDISFFFNKDGYYKIGID